MSFYRINIYFAIFCLCIIYIEGAQKKQIQQKYFDHVFSIANLHKLVIIFIQQWWMLSKFYLYSAARSYLFGRKWWRHRCNITCLNLVVPWCSSYDKSRTSLNRVKTWTHQLFAIVETSGNGPSWKWDFTQFLWLTFCESNLMLPSSSQEKS